MAEAGAAQAICFPTLGSQRLPVLPASGELFTWAPGQLFLELGSSFGSWKVG